MIVPVHAQMSSYHIFLKKFSKELWNVITQLLLLCRRLKSEKVFVHKNLLLSMGLGNLVGVLDVTLFKTREEHPVS